MQRLNLQQPQDDIEHESKVDEARRLQEEEIEITFELPDQSEARQKKLVYNDTVLLDPYSLTDYPDFEHKDYARIVHTPYDEVRIGKKKMTTYGLTEGSISPKLDQQLQNYLAHMTTATL
ncbi:hypothetical protein DYB28_010051, partial [Aphanomyces astaci]